MERYYYLGIDQGTTGTRAVLFDQNWKILSQGYHPVTLYYPREGWVESDAEEVWDSVQKSVAQALSQGGVSPRQIRSIGLDHEGETAVLWDSRTGKPLCRAVSWQDRRTSRYADRLAELYEDRIREITGLNADSYFSATKYRWMLDHLDQAEEYRKQGRLLGGTMDSWILWKISGGKAHITDPSTASRTMLYDIHRGGWSEELLGLFELPGSILPELKDSIVREVWSDPDSFQGLRAPVSGVLVDQQAALLGQGCVAAGEVKTTYGTGCFMLMNTGSNLTLSENGLISTVAWKTPERTTFALDGGVYVTGGAIKWLQKEMGLLPAPEASEELACSVSDNGGVYFVPAFSGMAAPYWDSYARGMMVGITGGTKKAHIVRAALEAAAYQVYDVLKVMRRDSGFSIPVMRCNGHATENRFLMQFTADILGIPLELPEVKESTALGSAFMGAIGVGDYQTPEDIRSIWRRAGCYEPEMSEEERSQLLYGWHRAVERAKYWSEE